MPPFRLPLICLLAWLGFAGAALAQSAEEAQMRLYIQQLEEQVRQLTGQNEQLSHEVRQLRAQLGGAGALDPQAGLVPPPAQPTVAQVMPGVQAPPAGELAPPAHDLGAVSVSPNDPLIAPDGGLGEPIDLSALAGGAPGAIPGQVGEAPVGAPASLDQGQAAPSPTTALAGAPRDEYDLAYGYVLTGDYALAEQSFANWLASFPGDPQAADAQFWLGESQFQQREFRDAANTFLALYKSAGASPKAPDALLKLGMSLAALGETNVACATFGEVGKQYPQASAALLSRVGEEAARSGC